MEVKRMTVEEIHEFTGELIKNPGRVVQSRCLELEVFPGNWMDLPNPAFNFRLYQYRLKQQPRVIYVNEYGGRVVFAYDGKDEAISAYAQKEKNSRRAVRYVEQPEE